jgi:hypothetical protein
MPRSPTAAASRLRGSCLPPSRRALLPLLLSAGLLPAVLHAAPAAAVLHCLWRLSACRCCWFAACRLPYASSLLHFFLSPLGFTAHMFFSFFLSLRYAHCFINLFLFISCRLLLTSCLLENMHQEAKKEKKKETHGGFCLVTERSHG